MPFFTWQQQQEFDIELSGILGVGKTQITGRPGKSLSLNSAKKLASSNACKTPEELFKNRNRLAGTHHPFSQLGSGQTRNSSTQIQRDNAKRAVQIIEDGWSVELSYNEQAHMPNRLIFKQALENGRKPYYNGHSKP